MTKEDLEKGNLLKERIGKYTQFLEFFTPVDMTTTAVIQGEENIYPPMIMPEYFPSKISLTANYIPSIITHEGTTAGRWEVVSASGINDSEILELINSLATLELSSIGGSIVDSALQKIEEMETEFDSL
jgi:hypothetical protein